MKSIQMKRVIPILLCGILAAIWQLAPAAHAQQSLRRAPSWSLYDATGQMRDLLDYRGKIVVLEMMQTTCPHCSAFADILEKVQQKYGDRVAILGVVTVLGSAADTPDKVKAYMSGHRVTYPILYDMGQMQYSYILKPNVPLPQVYLIDPAGNIRGDWSYGLTTRDIFEGKALFTEIDRLVGAPSKK
jgi:peroxiredoxin